DTYCEGALRDTVNFRRLIEDHNSRNDPLDEIWINRIVDCQQIRKPHNLLDALANLCQMFAATVGEDDVRLFKYHVKENANRDDAFKGIIVEIKVDSKINFFWSHANLNEGRRRGARMAQAALRLYEKYKDRKRDGRVLMIPDDLRVQEIKDTLGDFSLEEVSAVLVGHPEVRRNELDEDMIRSQLGPSSPR